MKEITTFIMSIFAIVCLSEDIVFDVTTYQSKSPKERKEYLISCNVFSESNRAWLKHKAFAIADDFFDKETNPFSFDKYFQKLKEVNPSMPEDSDTYWRYCLALSRNKNAKIEDIIKTCEEKITQINYKESCYNMIGNLYIYNHFNMPQNLDKAIEYFNKAKDKGISGLFRAYELKKDKENIWKVGKELLLEEYRTPAVCMNTVKTMLNRKPSSVKKEEVAEFMEELAEKYPTPGSNFDEWKAFMGFIGYKYKSITGKDLFKENK